MEIVRVQAQRGSQLPAVAVDAAMPRFALGHDGPVGQSLHVGDQVHRQGADAHLLPDSRHRDAGQRQDRSGCLQRFDPDQRRATSASVPEILAPGQPGNEEGFDGHDGGFNRRQDREIVL